MSLSSNAKALTFEQQLEAAVILGEARGERDARSLYAVKEVIHNRANKRGQSKYFVMTQKWQFSCLNQIAPADLIKKFNGSARWREAIDIVLSPATDYTKGADHYYADYIKAPSWAKSKYFTVQIGRHKFYRL